jgi:hypothetical protein
MFSNAQMILKTCNTYDHYEHNSLYHDDYKNMHVKILYIPPVGMLVFSS